MGSRPFRLAACALSLSAVIASTGEGTSMAEPRATTESAPLPILREGDCGDAVQMLQLGLKRLRYEPGSTDGCLDEGTLMAVWAFQKVNGLRATSVVGAATWRALSAPRKPRRLIRSHVPRTRVEIDLRRQILIVYSRGRPILISHISTGSRRRYCVRGRCGHAITWIGDFRVHRRVRGWHTSWLGNMYNPIYFRGGIAMHGSTRVPRSPSSHGCVRVPIPVARKLQRLVHIGHAVYVRRPPATSPGWGRAIPSRRESR